MCPNPGHFPAGGLAVLRLEGPGVCADRPIDPPALGQPQQQIRLGQPRKYPFVHKNPIYSYHDNSYRFSLSCHFTGMIPASFHIKLISEIHNDLYFYYLSSEDNIAQLNTY